MNTNKNKTLWSYNEFVDTMVWDTFRFQRIYGFELGNNGSAWNNESDAFRHAYMQAYLTLRFGVITATVLGNNYERADNKNHNQGKAEEIMDLYNNEIGREIGKEIYREYGLKSKNADQDEIKIIIARKVAERMQAGKLILDPSGRRTPKKKLNISGVNSRVNNKSNSQSQKGCDGSYHVSGYTREDGTKVEGYTRTCYKHSGMEVNRDLPEKFKGKKFQDLSPDELNEAISYFI